ncbi:hypothetical protein Gpo141_00006789 [Globisporangium polare]
MKLVFCYYASAVAALASLGAVTQALTVDSSAVAPPEDVVGEHQTLQRTWTISSAEELEKLHLLIPGRVFVDLEENLPAIVVPATVAPSQPTPAPSTPKPVVVVVGVTESTSGSGSSADSDDEVVFTSASSSSSASGSSDSDDDIVFPVPAVTVDAVAPASQAPKKVVPAVVVEEADGSSSLEGSNSGSGVGAVNVGDLTTQLRGGRELKEHDSDDKKHKKHHKPTEAVVAKIVVTGNSSALLELFEVIALHPSKENGLKIHLANKDANVEGFVLTQIILKNKNFIRHLSTELADDVVIGDGVFVEDDKDTTVKIATSGPGSVFIKSTAKVALDALTIDVAGSGVVQIDVPALKLEDSLDANVAGAGKIALLADAYLKSVQTTTAVSGGGSLIVQTKDFKAEDLVAAVYGSGSTSFASAGNVTTEKLTLSGSGKLLAGSIVAEKSSVSVWGSGDVIVQATDKLKVSTSFSGSVGYVGERPEKVKTSKWLFWRSDIVHPAAENTVIAYEAVAAPARYPLYYSLVTKQVFYAEDPIVKLTTGTTQSYLAVVSTHLSTVAHGPNGFLIFSMVATTLVVVALAANSFQKRRIRRHYRPLV